MNWQLLRTRLLQSHCHAPQEAARIERALLMAEDAVNELVRLGHSYHLAEGSQPEAEREEWPLLLYHCDGRVHEVFHPNDIVELGDGWYPTLAEAQYRAGYAAQMAGRGGVGRAQLPTIINGLTEISDGSRRSAPRADTE